MKEEAGKPAWRVLDQVMATEGETLAYGYFQLGLSGFNMDGCGVKEKSKVILRVLA